MKICKRWVVMKRMLGFSALLHIRLKDPEFSIHGVGL
jgi:hypothetical protein